MRVRWVSACSVALAIITGCGGKTDEPAPAPSGPSRPVDPVGQEPAPTAVSDFPDGTRSLELERTVSVRIEPGEDSKRIGTIAVDTRVRWKRTATGVGCKKPWVEIEPRGWVCSDYMSTSKKAPLGREVPMLDRGELVPGVYGKITAPNSVTYALEKPDPKKTQDKKPKPITSTTEVDAKPAEPRMIEGAPLVGSVTVRQYDEITVAGKSYWKVSKKDNEYVLESAITQHKPSLFTGSRLGDETGLSVPIAFVWPRVAGYQSTYTTNKTNGGGINRQLARRTPIAIVETSNDGAGKPLAYRIGDGEWIRAGDVRIFNPAPAPARLARGERWIDIDLDNQVLVAFEGDLAVYATMISSGKTDTPTTTGIYRMWLKESEADMKNLKSEDPYSVATVPWTQFFYPEEDLAVHTAYWHDQFGTKRSHGCVNVAPKDARWLYFWSDPQVPAGWTMATGIVNAPGSLVRVRTKDEPNPPLRGYARDVDDARRQHPPQ